MDTTNRSPLRSGLSLRLLGVVLLCAGCAGAGTVIRIVTALADDADYTLVSVSLSGPGAIAKNGQATYTVTYEFDVHSAGGSVAPFVSLLDDDNFLRFQNDLLVQEQQGGQSPGVGRHTRTLQLTLKCNNDIVEGVAATQSGQTGSSGEGNVVLFQTDEAEVFARVQRGSSQPTQTIDSQKIDVSCV